MSLFPALGMERPADFGVDFASTFALDPTAAFAVAFPVAFTAAFAVEPVVALATALAPDLSADLATEPLALGPLTLAALELAAFELAALVTVTLVPVGLLAAFFTALVGGAAGEPELGDESSGDGEWVSPERPTSSMMIASISDAEKSIRAAMNAKSRFSASISCPSEAITLRASRSNSARSKRSSGICKCPGRSKQ